MQYYTLELNKESKDLCVIATPFGLYPYEVLPMGVKQVTNISQEVMEDVLQNIKDNEAYLDDIGVFTIGWHNHLHTLECVLKALEDNNFAINPDKCEWAIQEMDWLGYWLTLQGLKPWQKKVDAILAMQPPTMCKELHSFIGTITFYCDMVP